MDFVIPADKGLKIKESEERDKFTKVVRDLNMLWNMKVTVTPIVIGALETIPKGFYEDWTA